MGLEIRTCLLAGLVAFSNQSSYTDITGNELEYDILEIFENVGIKMCSLKCTKSCYGRSLAYGMISRTCYVLKRHLDKTETAGDLLFIPQQMIHGLNEPCSTNTCGPNFNCLRDYHGRLKCVHDPNGKHYGEACSGHSECVDENTQCIDSVCTCLFGYSFIRRERSCVEVCTEYGTSVTLESYSHCITGHNSEVLMLSSSSECRTECLSRKIYTCRSFEMWKGNCSLSNYTKLDVPFSQWRVWNEFNCTYYQRNCA